MTFEMPNIKRLQKKAASAPRWMGENAFFGFLLLLFVALVLSSAVFYRYVFLTRNAQVQADLTQVTFQEQTLKHIVETWQERDTRFGQAGKAPVRNIFAPLQQPVQEEPSN